MVGINSGLKSHMEHFFKPKPPKNKKNSPQKEYLILRGMELPYSNIKSILIFFHKKYFLILSKAEPCPKKIHPEKNPLYFGKWDFLTLRLKKFLYLWK